MKTLIAAASAAVLLAPMQANAGMLVMIPGVDATPQLALAAAGAVICAAVAVFGLTRSDR